MAYDYDSENFANAVAVATNPKEVANIIGVRPIDGNLLTIERNMQRRGLQFGQQTPYEPEPTEASDFFAALNEALDQSAELEAPAEKIAELAAALEQADGWEVDVDEDGSVEFFFDGRSFVLYPDDFEDEVEDETDA